MKGSIKAKPLSLKLKVALCFALIIALIAATAVYNVQRIGRIAEQIALQHDKTEKQQLAMELKAKAIGYIGNGTRPFRGSATNPI